MGKHKNRIETSGPSTSSHNPFRALRDAEAEDEAFRPASPEESTAPATDIGGDPSRHRGRVDIVRQTAKRGGKAVILITNFIDTTDQEKRCLLRKLRKSCGTGGTMKDGNLEIQGEKRDEVKRILEAAGYRPVFSGG